MKNLSITSDKCQVSKKRDLVKILSLGYLPPVNNYHPTNKPKIEEIFFPAKLMYSKSSKLMQLDTVVKKEIIFPKSYPYTSSTTAVLRENFKDLYIECKKLKLMNKGDLIVDIGSNDGNLLSNFKKNNRVIGVTPERIGKIAIKKGINTLLRYFDRNVVNLILKKYGKAKIITATNVFAHIDNIDYLMNNIVKLLDSGGVFISESHYLE